MKCVTVLLSFVYSAIIILGVANGGRGETIPQLPSASTTSSSANGVIDDNAPGWIWSGMVEYDDPQLLGGTGRAGGPGSYAAYTFHGTGVEIFGMATASLTVNGRVHKVGRARVSIDGKEIATVNMSSPDTEFSYVVANVNGLANAIHVLQVEPVGGWAVIDYIRTTDPNSASSEIPEDKTRSKPDDKTKTGSTHASMSIPAGLYRICLRMDSSMFLSLRDTTPVNGSTAEIDHSRLDRMQIWQVTPIDGGRHYRIAPQSNLDVSLMVLSTTVSGTGLALGVWHDADIPVAKWVIIPTDPGYCRLESAAAQDEVADVLFSQDNEGASIILFNWHNVNGQQWSFVPVYQ